MPAALALAAVLGRAAVARPPDAEVTLAPVSNEIVLDVEVLGRSLRFGIDTGSEEVRLQPHAARRIGMVSGPEPATLLVRFETESDLRIGALTFPAVPIHVLPLFLDQAGLPRDNPAYDGLIGLNLLRKHAWGLDLATSKLAVWKGGRVDAASVAAWTGSRPGVDRPTASALGSVRGWPAWYAVEAFPAGGRARLILDLGSPVLVLREPRARAYGVVGTVPVGLDFLGGSGSAALGLAPELRFPWRTVVSPLACVVGDEGAPAVVRSLRERRVDGLMGWEAFSHARSVFDFPARRLSVAVDRTRAAQADRLAAFGFRFVPDEAGTYRAYVRPGGAADRGGLLTGDVVEEVDGLTPEAAAGAGAVGADLPADRGTNPTLRLKIRRGDERRTLTLPAGGSTIL